MKNHTKIADWINFANGITLVRLLLVPIILISLYKGNYASAVLLTSIAILSDFADGKVARWTSAETPFGAFFDPVADLILVTAIQIDGVSTGWWPAYLLTLSCASFISFAFRSVIAGRITGSKFGKYVGAVLMCSVLFSTVLLMLDPEEWIRQSHYICPIIGVYLAVSILDNLLAFFRTPGGQYETN